MGGGHARHLGRGQTGQGRVAQSPHLSGAEFVQVGGFNARHLGGAQTHKLRGGQGHHLVGGQRSHLAGGETFDGQGTQGLQIGGF